MKKSILPLLLLLLLLLCWGSSAIADGAVPALKDLYPEIPVHLNETRDMDFRVMAYCGPSKTYAEAGGYKPWKQTGITGLFIEADYMLIHLRYQTVQDRYLYIRVNWFDKNNSVPTVDSLTAYQGKALAQLSPSWGPGSDYVSFSGITVPLGTAMQVFFEADGYLYAECAVNGEKFRAWYPANEIEVNGIPEEVISTADAVVSGKSGWTDLPVGVWSDWTLTKVTPTANREVETRSVTYISREILTYGAPVYEEPQDLSSGSDGWWASGIDYDADGNEITIWRYVTINYGPWKRMEEDEYPNSSGDQMEVRTEYRYRWLK